jgi:glycosyltransferase involved in cell wall biosynthesis
VSRPRLLLVGRRRYRLPLDASLARKFDAMGEVFELRVLGSAPRGAPTADATFRLVPPSGVGALDGLLFYLLLPLRIARQLRDFRPDAVLAQGTHEAAAAIAARAMARRRVRVILDVHGDWRTATRLYGSRARRILSPVGDAVATWAVRRADAVRTVSDFTSRLVRELGVEPSATFPAFMDIEPFLRAPVPLPSKPRVLFVGVFELYKGVDVLAAAWPSVASRVPDAELRIVGKGRRADLVRGLGTQVADLTTEQVARELDHATCLVLPSRREGMGRVVVEALCRARPVVGSRDGGIEDLVRDGENGLLVPPEDPNALADALVRVLTDSELAARLSARARSSVDAWLATPEEFAERLRALVAALD